MLADTRMTFLQPSGPAFSSLVSDSLLFARGYRRDKRRAYPYHQPVLAWVPNSILFPLPNMALMASFPNRPMAHHA